MKEGVNTLLSSLLGKDLNVLLICVIPCGSLWIGLTLILSFILQALFSPGLPLEAFRKHAICLACGWDN